MSSSAFKVPPRPFCFTKKGKCDDDFPPIPCKSICCPKGPCSSVVYVPCFGYIPGTHLFVTDESNDAEFSETSSKPGSYPGAAVLEKVGDSFVETENGVIQTSALTHYPTLFHCRVLSGDAKVSNNFCLEPPVYVTVLGENPTDWYNVYYVAKNPISGETYYASRSVVDCEEEFYGLAVDLDAETAPLATPKIGETFYFIMRSRFNTESEEVEDYATYYIVNSECVEYPPGETMLRQIPKNLRGYNLTVCDGLAYFFHTRTHFLRDTSVWPFEYCVRFVRTEVLNSCDDGVYLIHTSKPDVECGGVFTIEDSEFAENPPDVSEYNITLSSSDEHSCGIHGTTIFDPTIVAPPYGDIRVWPSVCLSKMDAWICYEICRSKIRYYVIKFSIIKDASCIYTVESNSTTTPVKFNDCDGTCTPGEHTYPHHVAPEELLRLADGSGFDNVPNTGITTPRHHELYLRMIPLVTNINYEAQGTPIDEQNPVFIDPWSPIPDWGIPIHVMVEILDSTGTKSSGVKKPGFHFSFDRPFPFNINYLTIGKGDYHAQTKHLGNPTAACTELPQHLTWMDITPHKGSTTTPFTQTDIVYKVGDPPIHRIGDVMTVQKNDPDDDDDFQVGATAHDAISAPVLGPEYVVEGTHDTNIIFFRIDWSKKC